MTDGDASDRRTELLTWAQEARVRSAACAARALEAAESAATIGAQVDRIIERAAERNPERAAYLQAILVTAASQRAVIAGGKSSHPEGPSSGQLLHSASTGPVTAVGAEPDGLPVDLGIVHDLTPADGELQDAVIQRIFMAGLTLQDAARLTAEPGARWRLEAAVGDLDELIRFIRDALFNPAQGPKT